MSTANAFNDDIKCIDASAFHCEKTLSNKNCFWSLLQSQTDQMHYYYQDQLQSILLCLDKFKDYKRRRNYETRYVQRYVISSLQSAKLSTEHLHEFLQSSFRDFKLVVKKFDEYHSTNTLAEEIDYFHSCHDYIDGKHLDMIIQHIEERIESIEADRFKAEEQGSREISLSRDTSSRKNRTKSSWTKRAIKKMTTQSSEKSKDTSVRNIDKEQRNKGRKTWFVSKLPLVKFLSSKRMRS